MARRGRGGAPLTMPRAADDAHARVLSGGGSTLESPHAPPTTGAEAVRFIKGKLYREEVPHDLATAIVVLMEHVGTLERTLVLLRSGVESALAHQPPNAVHAVAHGAGRGIRG